MLLDALHVRYCSYAERVRRIGAAASGAWRLRAHSPSDLIGIRGSDTQKAVTLLDLAVELLLSERPFELAVCGHRVDDGDEAAPASDDRRRCGWSAGGRDAGTAGFRSIGATAAAVAVAVPSPASTPADCSGHRRWRAKLPDHSAGGVVDEDNHPDADAAVLPK